MGLAQYVQCSQEVTHATIASMLMKTMPGKTYIATKIKFEEPRQHFGVQAHVVSTATYPVAGANPYMNILEKKTNVEPIVICHKLCNTYNTTQVKSNQSIRGLLGLFSKR
jgi:hypothetical protein